MVQYFISFWYDDIQEIYCITRYFDMLITMLYVVSAADSSLLQQYFSPG